MEPKDEKGKTERTAGGEPQVKRTEEAIDTTQGHPTQARDLKAERRAERGAGEAQEEGEEELPELELVKVEHPSSPAVRVIEAEVYEVDSDRYREKPRPGPTPGMTLESRCQFCYGAKGAGEPGLLGGVLVCDACRALIEQAKGGEGAAGRRREIVDTDEASTMSNVS
jgi:hypothetical protein